MSLPSSADNSVNPNRPLPFKNFSAMVPSNKWMLASSMFMTIDAGDIDNHQHHHLGLPTRTCKICFGTELEEPGQHWLRPCKCSGSIEWVHRDCFNIWMVQAPPGQQQQCSTCKWTYERCCRLKPFADWCWPSIKSISLWDIVEMALDAYGTVRLIRGLSATIDGKRSVWMQLLHFIFWRLFIATDRRVAHYAGLARAVGSSVFEFSVRNYVPPPLPPSVSRP